MTSDRRAFLASTLTVAAGLSGCLAGGPDGGDGDDPTRGTPASTETTTDEAESNDDSDSNGTDEPVNPANFGIDHPAMAGAENDPVLGPPPDEAEIGFLLFSEPSCPYCRDFHENTWDRMKEELVDPGRLSFVYRPFPKVREWAPQASYALLEVWDRDEEAFVRFKEYCYDNSHDLALDPADAVAAYLNENTDVDGDAVADAVENFERVDDVAESMDAAREADMTTIPSYAILREGDVIETTSGVQSYANVKRMLGVD